MGLPGRMGKRGPPGKPGYPGPQGLMVRIGVQGRSCTDLLTGSCWPARLKRQAWTYGTPGSSWNTRTGTSRPSSRWSLTSSFPFPTLYSLVQLAPGASQVLQACKDPLACRVRTIVSESVAHVGEGAIGPAGIPGVWGRPGEQGNDGPAGNAGAPGPAGLSGKGGQRAILALVAMFH
eukprot:763379-Hanusia_phi.AAC.9